MNFLIIHGSYGSKDGNWFPWLKKELENNGHTVYLPQFPVGKDKQNLENWKKIIDELNIPFGNDLIIVAHSIGPSFALSLLEKYQCKICFFVSGFLALLGNEEFDVVNKTFVIKPFDWNEIKENCSEFVLYHGENDPYVPLEFAKDFASKIGVELEIIPDGGHLNEEAGYTKFPVLLEKIKGIIN